MTAKEQWKIERQSGRCPPPAGPGSSGRKRRRPRTAPAPDTAAAPAAGDASQSSSELSQRASDGYLVNGSSVNGASSNFGLNPAIGNNRRGPRSLYNGNIGFTSCAIPR